MMHHRLRSAQVRAAAMWALTLAWAVLPLAAGCAPSRERREYDLVIYGGTSAGVAAAVQASRMGASVAIVCPEDHIGGMTTNGLGWTDSGDKAVIGGISREFYRRIKLHYESDGAWQWEDRDGFARYRADEDAMWVFEPHAAEWVMGILLAETGVPVFHGRWLDRERGVRTRGGRIESIRMLSGERFAGRVYIDATYEGDLMAAAGVSYAVGREANSVYGETLNGVQTGNAVKHQFEVDVDPFVVEGDPSSGLLARLDAGGPGVEGEGDHRVQAYTYRLCMTRVPENRVAFTEPAGYDPEQYGLLLRYLIAKPDATLIKPDGMPNAKTDTNNNGAFSTDNIGMNYAYPEATYAERAEILAEHERYQRGFFWFLVSDPRLPESVRARMGEWGLAADEFRDNANWPRQIYVREARRMVGEVVMTEPMLRGIEPTPGPVGMGSYNMDSHHVQRYVAHTEDGRAVVRNEGDVQVSPGGAYPISYGAIVPRRGECENLLVPVCVSASHIAYGSIRMEPVFMVLGQSAATAGVMAMRRGVAVQDLEYAALREQLLADGQVLEHGEARARGVASSSLGGIVIDDGEATREGSWTASNSVASFVGGGSPPPGGGGAGAAVTFIASPPAGVYEVRVSYAAHENRASRVPVSVEWGDVRQVLWLDQRSRPPIDGLWAPVGRVAVTPGEQVVLRIGGEGADGFVVADAVQLIPVDD